MYSCYKNGIVVEFINGECYAINRHLLVKPEKEESHGKAI